MSLSAYFYVNRGIDCDLPFREAATEAAKYCDEVIIGSDPRFEDDTIQELKTLAKRLTNVKVVIEEFDFNCKNPHAAIKNRLRGECSGSWLLELDADKIIPKESGDLLKKKLSQIPDSVYIVSLGNLPFFNGDNVKLYDGSEEDKACYKITQDCLSRNLKSILHGGLERRGSGYISSKGLPLKAGYRLCSRNWKTPDPSDIWIFHYGWFCLPRRWEMKQTHHYYEGRMSEVYKSLDDYHLNLDGEPVDFWDIPWQRSMDHYIGACFAEMTHPAIKPWHGTHPKTMMEWIDRQRGRVLESSKDHSFFKDILGKNIKMILGAKR